EDDRPTLSGSDTGEMLLEDLYAPAALDVGQREVVTIRRAHCAHDRAADEHDDHPQSHHETSAVVAPRAEAREQGASSGWQGVSGAREFLAGADRAHADEKRYRQTVTPSIAPAPKGLRSAVRSTFGRLPDKEN